jgi:putative heme utilization carrier protein HutX
VSAVAELSLVTSTPADRLDMVRQLLATKPDGVVEAVAREAGVPTQVVLEALPDAVRRFAPAERFDEIWADMTGWGEVLFIVHTPDIVLECEGALPAGSHASGYFNIHGDSPIGGHIRAANCRAIYLVDRMFHGRRSCSVQFYNAAGEAMFKVFVRRDKERNLRADQLARFEALRAALAVAPAA